MKARMKKIAALLSASIMSMSLLTGTCVVNAEEAGSTPRNETLYFAGQQWGTINDWNPLSSNSNNAMGVAQQDMSRVLIYESLFLYNNMDGQLHPLLGKDYAWNDEQTEMTIHLNPDAKWSDGTQVTAEDVAYTWEAHVKYNTGIGADYSAYIDNIEATDAETVVIKAKLDEEGKAINPLKILEYIPKVYVIQKAYMQTVEERNGNDADKIKMDKMEDFVSSGPYTKYFDDEQKIVFVRDDEYWGQAESMWGSLPAPKYITHVIYKDNGAGQIGFAKGEVDIAQMFITDIQKLWEEDGLPITTYMDEAPYGVGTLMPTCFMNMKRNGLDQVEVRKAIAMAVDFEHIVASAMSNQSATFEQVPRSVMNATDAEQAMIDKEKLADLQFGNDVDAAIKILDDAGIVDTDGDNIREFNGENLSYTMECPDGWTDWMAACEDVAKAGQAIGIDIQTNYPDLTTYAENYQTGNFDLCINNVNGSSISNPWGRCMQLMSSTYADQEINTLGNWSGYKNDEVDEILAKIPFEQDADQLKEYYTRLSEIYLTDVPAFTLMYRPQQFFNVNESVWTNYPMYEDGTNIPPTSCTDGYGVAGLYQLQLVEEME